MNAKSEQYVRTLMSFNEKHALILTKLYSLKAKLIQAPSSPYLVDVSLAKVRYTVDRKFPVLIDLSQSSGFSALMDAAGDIISLYDPLVRVMREVSVYMKSMLTLLKSPYIFNLDLNFNRLILFAWMDCFAAYVKVMFFLEKFPEAMPMILLFFAAKSVAGSLKQANASAQEFHWLKKATANIRRHLIDEFTPLQCSLLHIINEIKDIVCFSYDIHGLRELFDPSNTDIELSGYHLMILGKKACFTELSRAPRYADFIILAVLACPALFFDEEVLDLLQTVTEHVFMVSLFRDITINVHKELELIFTSYPTEADTQIVKIPKQFKLSTQLKTLSRQSLSNAGRHQIIRRRLLTHFLQDMILFLQVLPGIINAKIIVMMLACTWLNEEISCYAQHYPGFYVRKDTKSYFDSELYAMDDLGSALQILHESVSLITASWQQAQMIPSFYQEYVLDIDLPVLQDFVATHNAVDKNNGDSTDMTTTNTSNSGNSGTNYTNNVHVQKAMTTLQQTFQLWREQIYTTNTNSNTSHNIEDENHHNDKEIDKTNDAKITVELLQRVIADAIHALSYRGQLETFPSISTPATTNNTISNSNSNSNNSNNNATRASLLPPPKQEMRSSVTGIPIMSVAAAQLSQIPSFPPVSDTAYILSTLYEHLLFVHAHTAPAVLSYLDPFRIGWFREVLKASLSASISVKNTANTTAKNVSSSNITVSSTCYAPFFSFFHPLESSMLNIHPQVMEELLPVGEHAARCATEMIQSFTDQIVSCFKQMWGKLAQLEMQCHPNELIARLDRMIQQTRLLGESHYHSNSNNNSHGENIHTLLSHPSLGIVPGFESELWAEESLTDFMALQKRLYQLLHAVKRKPIVRIFNKEFRVLVMVRQQLQTLFVDKCHLLKRQVTDVVSLMNLLQEAASNIGDTAAAAHPTNVLQQARFSVLVWRYEVGSKLLQQVFSLLGEKPGFSPEKTDVKPEFSVDAAAAAANNHGNNNNHGNHAASMEERNVGNILREIKRREVFGLDMTEEIDALLVLLAQEKTAARNNNNNHQNNAAITTDSNNKSLSLGQMVLQQQQQQVPMGTTSSKKPTVSGTNKTVSSTAQNHHRLLLQRGNNNNNGNSELLDNVSELEENSVMHSPHTKTHNNNTTTTTAKTQMQQTANTTGINLESVQSGYVALGNAVPLDHLLPADTLIDALCDWFEVLVTDVLSTTPNAPTTSATTNNNTTTNNTNTNNNNSTTTHKSSNSTWVYVPHQHNFVHYTRLKHLQQLAKYQQQVAQANSSANSGNNHANNSANNIDTSVYFPPADLLLEVLLQAEELQSLVTFVGVHGVRLLEGRLLAIIQNQLKDVIAVLSRNYVHYAALTRDYCFSVAVAQSLEGMDALVQALRIIGIALTVRQMLLAAVHSVSQHAAPNFHALLATLHASLDPASHLLATTNTHIAFYHLTHALGMCTTSETVGGTNHGHHSSGLSCQSPSLVCPNDSLGFDFALFESLIAAGFTSSELQLLQTLPVVAASLLVHPRSGSFSFLQYDSDHDVFQHNEHLVGRALACLFAFTVNLAEHLQQPVEVAGLSEKTRAGHDSFAQIGMFITNNNNNNSNSNSSGEKNTTDMAVSEVDMLALANATVLHANKMFNQHVTNNSNNNNNTATTTNGIIIDALQLRTHKLWLRHQVHRSFLRYASQLLLTRRERESSFTVNSVPFAGLFAFLRHFVQSVSSVSGLVTLHTLHEFVPYDLLQHWLVDSSLGKVTGRDAIHAFHALPREQQTQQMQQIQQEEYNMNNNNSVNNTGNSRENVHQQQQRMYDEEQQHGNYNNYYEEEEEIAYDG